MITLIINNVLQNVILTVTIWVHFYLMTIDKMITMFVLSGLRINNYLTSDSHSVRTELRGQKLTDIFKSCYGQTNKLIKPHIKVCAPPKK